MSRVSWPCSGNDETDLGWMGVAGGWTAKRERESSSGSGSGRSVSHPSIALGLPPFLPTLLIPPEHSSGPVGALMVCVSFPSVIVCCWPASISDQ